MATAKVGAEIVEITPKLAEKWLGANTHNRNIRQRQVDYFAGAMTREEWLLNGDAIRFDINGRLIDGQHRLLAVVKAGVPVKSLVVHGLVPEAQETIDAGARRTFSDVLKLRGETNTALLAAVTRLHWRYHNNVDDMLNRNTMPTTQQLLAHLERTEHLRDSARRAQQIIHAIKGLGSVYGTAVALALEVADEDDVDFFLERLMSGTELSATSPIYHLRQYLLKQLERRDKHSQEIQLAMWIKAWNAYRDGRAMEVLIYRAGGKSAERYPVIH